MLTDSQRNDYLQQLGITQYVLHRPAALRGEVGLSLSTTTRLVLIADEPPRLDDPLLQDIIMAMGLQADEVMLINLDQAEMLPDTSDYLIWQLGSRQQDFPHNTILNSPTWAELRQQPAAKRVLWQQIYNYEHDIFPDRT